MEIPTFYNGGTIVSREKSLSVAPREVETVFNFCAQHGAGQREGMQDEQCAYEMHMCSLSIIYPSMSVQSPTTMPFPCCILCGTAAHEILLFLQNRKGNIKWEERIISRIDPMHQ